MLVLPNYIFLNCISTYFYAIHLKYSKAKSQNDILLFLSDTSLNFFEQDYTENKEKYSLGWYSQPVDLIFQNVFTPDYNWHYALADYMRANLNYEINFSKLEWCEVLEKMKYKSDDFHFMILEDDFYNPNGKFAYNKVHDTHWLYIEQIDFEKNEATVLDSNYKRPNKISLEDLSRAYNSKYNTKETVEVKSLGSNYDSFIDRSNECFENITLDFESLITLKDEYLKIDCIDDWVFMLEGINNSIQAKIVPYYNFLLYLIINKILSPHDYTLLISYIEKNLKSLQSIIYRNLIMIDMSKLKYFEVNKKIIDEITTNNIMIIKLIEEIKSGIIQ